MFDENRILEARANETEPKGLTLELPFDLRNGKPIEFWEMAQGKWRGCLPFVVLPKKREIVFSTNPPTTGDLWNNSMARLVSRQCGGLPFLVPEPSDHQPKAICAFSYPDFVDSIRALNWGSRMFDPETSFGDLEEGLKYLANAHVEHDDNIFRFGGERQCFIGGEIMDGKEPKKFGSEEHPYHVQLALYPTIFDFCNTDFKITAKRVTASFADIEGALEEHDYIVAARGYVNSKGMIFEYNSRRVTISNLISTGADASASPVPTDSIISNLVAVADGLNGALIAEGEKIRQRRDSRTEYFSKLIAKNQTGDENV